MLAQWLFRAARWAPMGPAVALGLRYLGPLLPLRRVWSSPGLVGFYHPRPSWREHVVLVPTTPIRDLVALGQPRWAPLFADIVLAAGAVLRRMGVAGAEPYVLCANGGDRQDVQQVHFHLLRGERWVLPLASSDKAARLITSAEWDVVRHPRPVSETHVVLLPKPRLPPLLRLTRAHTGQLAGLAGAVPLIHRELALGAAGYTLLMQGEIDDERPLELHLISGERTPGTAACD